MDTLQLLKEEKINCEKAIKLINSYNLDKSNTKKSRKIKVFIYDSEDDRTIKLPAIPFGLITSLSSFALWISSIALKNSKELDNDSKKAIEVLKDVDVKEVLNALRNCPPCELVNVYDGEDGDEVIISIL